MSLRSALFIQSDSATELTLSSVGGLVGGALLLNHF